ncbi:MAG: outer membrane protein assembly factor BamD [Flavobacteriales bacterium]|jgi:outer membrane protein assembly factor BamD|nr:outer membrane protein assembly factor BamD [Flavobacteriales bacterium]MBT4705194.1 outer membrane protein assembly factor BamD [Flavobacteriales bacterium]MBT4930390.1 outer membrane protein assembly factor BamD [Flavobacteriales bacterium]MBT5977952.1 outer membrane protein assembly factor BamD [Flavobacteriales bacterium]MBT6383513.1 outer membrane protein assembly factor BamD [Flavobacteriales bacterium]
MRGISFATALLALILISSCSDYRKVLKSKDMQYKYDTALEFYKDGKYAKAYPLFEELNIAYRGTEKGEKIAYYQAKCDYLLRDYMLGSHRFQQFYRNYPSSKMAEEAEFLAAYCNYQLSPKFSLDQNETYKAIRSFQLFAIDYPDSKRIDSCNMLLDELRGKLEHKDYRASMLYYKTSSYRAAQQALSNFNKEYPYSEHKEECWFLEYKAGYLLAFNSVDDKKNERIDQAMKAYVTFVDRFPESKYLREAESMFDSLQKQKGDT